MAAIGVAEHAPSVVADRRAEATPATWLLLAGVTAVAVALRVLFAGEQSLGYEEVFTRSIVNQSSLSAVWNGVRATESTPPLYYVLSWLWVKLSGSDGAVALRTISLLAGSLSVPAAFFAMRYFVSVRLALVVAWLCAISPLLFAYSLYARSYALLVATATLSVWALGALLERPSWRRWTLWALAISACLWTHYFAVFLLVAQAGVLLVRLPAARVRLLACLGAIAALTAPLWPVFIVQSGASARTAFIAAQPLSGRLEGVVRQFAMGTNVPASWLEAAGIVVAGVAVAFAALRTRRVAPNQVLGAIAVIGAGVPIAAAVTGIDDQLLPRNLLGVWICVAPFAAHGLTRLRSAPLALYSVICLATVVATQSDWRYGVSDWGGASTRIEAKARGEPVAVMPGLEFAVAGVYLHRGRLRAPIATTDLWVMVQPERGAGERALTPVANPPLAQLWGSQFHAVAEIDYHGFRMIHLQAGSPTSVAPAPADNGLPATPDAFVLAP